MHALSPATCCITTRQPTACTHIIHTSLLPHPQEGDAYEVVPGTEFTVTRTANRNNTSDYYINSKRVSTKEVTTLLKEKGIDLDNNRFLILQVGAGADTVTDTDGKTGVQCVPVVMIAPMAWCG